MTAWLVTMCIKRGIVHGADGRVHSTISTEMGWRGGSTSSDMGRTADNALALITFWSLLSVLTDELDVAI